uniref:Lipid droplet assembly factor 1 n=2 Tax=Sus scrofa TaxID=9823 RepID=A0A8D0ZSJ6_PIG
MAKEEPPSISKDLQELQRKLSLLIDSVQNNSKVVALMKSPVGQYLDKHPFLTLTLLVFVAVSAVPVGFFILLVVLTSLAAFVGVILLEGLVISVGGLSLLCVLCGLGFVSLIISGIITVSYVVVSSLVNYWFSPRLLTQHNCNTGNIENRCWSIPLCTSRFQTFPPSTVQLKAHPSVKSHVTSGHWFYTCRPCGPGMVADEA